MKEVKDVGETACHLFVNKSDESFHMQMTLSPLAPLYDLISELSNNDWASFCESSTPTYNSERL